MVTIDVVAKSASENVLSIWFFYAVDYSTSEVSAVGILATHDFDHIRAKSSY